MELHPTTATTSAELFEHSWSAKTAQLCMDNPKKIGDLLDRFPRTLTQELAERAPDPGLWQNVYLDNLKDLFEKEAIPYDITFRVGTEIVEAHRCILEARKFWTYVFPTSEEDGNNLPEGEAIVIEDPKFLEHPKSFRAAVAACYGVRDSSRDRYVDISRHDCVIILERLREEDNPGPRIDISRDLCDIVQDLGKLNPNSSDDETAGLLLRSPPDLWIKGSSSACADKDACWTVPAHKVLLGAHSEYFRSALGWHNSDEDEEEDAGGHVIHLDSDQFSLELVQQLVSACYGTLGYLANEDGNDDGNGWAYVVSIHCPADKAQLTRAWRNAPKEVLQNLIQGAVYLMIQVATLRYESILVDRLTVRNVVQRMTFAEENGAQCLYLGCYRLLTRSLKDDSESFEWDVSNLQWENEEEPEDVVVQPQQSPVETMQPQQRDSSGGTSSTASSSAPPAKTKKNKKNWRERLRRSSSAQKVSHHDSKVCDLPPPIKAGSVAETVGHQDNKVVAPPQPTKSSFSAQKVSDYNRRARYNIRIAAYLEAKKALIISRHNVLQLNFHQLLSLLPSSFLQYPEDEILEMVLVWSSIQGSSRDETKELVAHVRLPFVPVNSVVMRKAVEAGLVSRDMLRDCRLFQTNTDYREAVVNTDIIYRARVPPALRMRLYTKIRISQDSAR